jgi:DNA-binding NtrC family response regulator
MSLVGRSLALIVEDDRFQRDILTEILKSEDLDVIACETAEAAELVVANFGAELKLLVTDVNLGDKGNGIDLAAYAKGCFPYLNVVVISGQPRDPPPGVHFLGKPFLPPQLLKLANLSGG